MHAHAYIVYNFLKTYGQIEITVKKKVAKKIFSKNLGQNPKNKCLLKKISLTLKNLPPIYYVNFEKSIIISEKSLRKNFF